MHRYKVQQGEEGRVFGGEGVRNLGDGVVESDTELNSPYLTLVEDEAAQKEQTQMTATPNPQLAAPVVPPAAPAAPAPAQLVAPPANPAPANQGEAK